MASIQKGTAVVWSLGTTATGTGVGAGVVQNVTFTPSAKMVELVGADAATKTEVYFNQKEQIQLEIVPTSASNISGAQSNFIVPEMGADLTVVDSVDTEIAGSSTTVYIVDTASKSKTIEGIARVNITAHRYTAGQLATIS